MRAVITYLRRLIGATSVVIPCGATPGRPGQARSALRILAVIARIAYVAAKVGLVAAPSYGSSML
jgi:hypothetical protein